MTFRFDSHALRKALDTDRLRAVLQPQHSVYFIDRNSQPLSLDSKEKVNLILSPSFYWVRREKLPVRFAYQAKGLLPSVFDGLIPEGEYQYEAVKDGEDYLVFAYSNKDIIEALESLGIRFSQINNVYFSQIELGELEEPLLIDEQWALYGQDGITAVVPASLVQARRYVEERLPQIRLSRHKLTLSKFNLFIDQQTFNYAASILIGFIVLFIVEFWMLKQEKRQMLSEQERIYSEYRLPMTSFEVEAIKKRLFGYEKQQLRIRDAFKALAEVKLKSEEHLQSILYEGKDLEFKVVLQEPKRAEAIKASLEKSLKFSSIKVVDDVMFAKVAL